MPLEFNAPAGDSLFDKAKVVGSRRIDGPHRHRHRLATSATTWHEPGLRLHRRCGHRQGAHHFDGCLRARAAPGVLAVITTRKPSRSAHRTGTMRRCSADPKYYHQAIACVVAETFEQAPRRRLIRTRYERSKGPLRFPGPGTVRAAGKGVTEARPAGAGRFRHRLRERRGQARRDLPRPTKVIR